jgi:ABC-type transport system involved in multi-copper enzyme maturation permease subunit
MGPSGPAASPLSRVITPDRRGSWIPPWRLVTAKLMELRRRRGMMVAVLLLSLGVIVVLNIIFLLLHATDPTSYGPAGGLNKFRPFSLAFVQVFGISAVLIGAAAGSTDLSDGMFRHLVSTGRSRFALFFARIPAGLLLILPITAFAYLLESLIAVYAAPSGPQTVIQGIQRAHVLGSGSGVTITPHIVVESAVPSIHLLIEVGAWLMLQVAVAFVIGLGLGALTGSRSATIAILIALQLVVTPILSSVTIPHLVNLQRAFVGVAVGQLEPSGLTGIGGNNGMGRIVSLPPMPAFGVVIVILGWVVGWLFLGAWRMARRDA